MRLFTLLFFLFSISLTAQRDGTRDLPTRANCTEGGCIVNAGQDQVICSDGALVLRGENSEDFAQSLNAVWEAAPGNPVGLTINDPNSLVTAVSAANGTYPPGTYTFSLTVSCTDGSTSCSETSVTVVELPDIKLIIPETPECSNTVFLARSGELPEGVTDLLVFSPPSSVSSIEEVPGGFLITRNPGSGCALNFEYTIFGGSSCRAFQSGRLEVVGPVSPPNARALNVSCETNTISGRLWLLDANTGCSEYSITATSTPVGVTAGDVVYSQINLDQFVYNFSAPAGDYTFELSFTNICGTVSSSIDVTCPDIDSCSRIPSSSQTIVRRFCGSLTDLSTVQLTAREYTDARYEWSIFRVPEWLHQELTFDGAQATVNLTTIGTPDPENTGITYRVLIYDELRPDCPPAVQFVGIRVPFPIGTIDDRVNINCGVGSVYPLSRNLPPNRQRGFQILSHPVGYTGVTIGDTGDQEGILQLSQIGTYEIVFEYRTRGFDDVINEFVTCNPSDTFTIVVDDIPNIDAGSDAIICDDNIQLNGSTPRNAAGFPVDINILWEPVEEYPGVTISDATIRNPVVTGLIAGQSYTFRYAFPGDPNCEKEDLVTITVNEKCDETPDLTCDLTLRSRCTICGCGEDVFVATAYDSNGDRLDVDVWEIEWFIGGEPAITGVQRSYISRHYEGPTTVTVIATTELANGEKCTLERTIAVNCAGDCPILSFEYDDKSCEEDYFYGEVTIVDQAGNPVVFAGFDWYSDGGSYDDNPYLLFSEPGEVVPVTVSFYSPYRCEVEMEFEPNCFKGDDISKRAAPQDHSGYTTSPLTTSVYPNPADHNEPVTVHFGEHVPASLGIMDLSGRIVFQTQLPKGAREYRLSPTSLPTGVMIVVLRDEVGKALDSQRFVVR
ncbi:PKD domain-containing protein [Neolewinella persica]|uniref:PKD domain-containing protein n=1 Tax=Neolewinella persica TaxID=70998 RepID=UPI0003AA45F5|nr:T9SS type A sorting domain-containing protein [Neolewinella persica]